MTRLIGTQKIASATAASTPIRTTIQRTAEITTSRRPCSPSVAFAISRTPLAPISGRGSPDDVAPSGWDRWREVAWHVPRLLSGLGPLGPRGPEDGPPALVIPGFLATDRTTMDLRRALARAGWRSHPWLLGMNGGAKADTMDLLASRLEAIWDGRPILVVGWSLGGMFAREIAHRVPERIRAVVTLSCDLIKGRSPVMTWPRIETPDSLVTVAVGRPLEEALWGALRDLILWVVERTGMTKQQAYLLIGTAGHARPGQAQVGLYSMRCMVPKGVLLDLG